MAAMCFFRKPDKTEEEEASDACPYCEYILPQTKLDCPECKNNIPYCIITVSIWTFGYVYGVLAHDELKDVFYVVKNSIVFS